MLNAFGPEREVDQGISTGRKCLRYIDIYYTNPVKHFNSLLSHHKVSLFSVQKNISTTNQIEKQVSKLTRSQLQDVNYFAVNQF